LVDGGRWLVDGGRWLVDGGRWLVDGGWWTVVGKRRWTKNKYRKIAIRGVENSVDFETMYIGATTPKQGDL